MWIYLEATTNTNMVRTPCFICLIVLLVIRLFSHIDSYFIHPHRSMDTVGNGVCIEGRDEGGLVTDAIWCVLYILVIHILVLY